MDVRFDASEGDKTVVERLDERHLLAWIRREELFAQLDIEVESILVALAIHGNEVLRSESRELCEYRLDLTWEYVHATNDEHIVTSAKHLTQTNCCTSALARLVVKAREVASTIAEDWHSLLAKRSDDQFANFAWSNWLECFRIDYFGQEEVFPDVCAVLIQTFTAHTRPTHFGQTVDIDCLDVELCLEFTTDAPSPGLCTKEADTQLKF